MYDKVTVIAESRSVVNLPAYSADVDKWNAVIAVMLDKMLAIVGPKNTTATSMVSGLPQCYHLGENIRLFCALDKRNVV